LIASSGAVIATNPSSNLHLRSGVAPISEAIKRGCRVALGVDASALDEDDDILREMRLGHFLHGGWGFDGAIERGVWLSAIVGNGRFANGAPGSGELAVGEPADILVLDLDALDRDAVMAVEPIDFVFARATAAHVSGLIVAGEEVVRDERLARVDLKAAEAELRQQYRMNMPSRAAFLAAWGGARACGSVLLSQRPRLLLTVRARERIMARALPIVDLSASDEGGRTALDKVAAEIGAACRNVGFFYAVNHGVEAKLIAEAFVRSREFFALPLADKRKLAIEKIGGNRGYSGLLHEALDPARGPDMKEAFNVGFDLAPDDPELLAGKPFRSLNAWPEAPGFRETLLAYYNVCAALGAQLHRAFALDFGLKPDFFADKFDRPMATLRLLHYPAPSRAADAQTGAGEHTDYGNLTLLATDDVGGLEVRTRAGQWIEAPVLPNAFIVNIGDCLMRWTNDVYVSTPHRVVNRSAKERYSIAFFFDPNPGAMVEAIASCVRQGESARYPPILAADYLKIRLDASKPAEADRAMT
jgi:isopenicillin N synthase-like dioxygenase